jgi:hypothetical protein
VAILRKITFECDGCGDELDTELVDFGDAKEVANEEGWRLRKEDGGDWLNLCPDCAND